MNLEVQSVKPGKLMAGMEIFLMHVASLNAQSPDVSVPVLVSESPLQSNDNCKGNYRFLLRYFALR